MCRVLTQLSLANGLHVTVCIGPICYVECASLTAEQLNGFCSYSMFKSLCIIGRCSVYLSIPAPKIWAVRMGPQITK
jgi:hypothetical protein